MLQSLAYGAVVGMFTHAVAPEVALLLTKIIEDSQSLLRPSMARSVLS